MPGLAAATPTLGATGTAGMTLISRSSALSSPSATASVARPVRLPPSVGPRSRVADMLDSAEVFATYGSCITEALLLASGRGYTVEVIGDLLSVGTFHYDLRDGQGTVTGEDGYKYEGTWVAGRIEGTGTVVGDIDITTAETGAEALELLL